MITTLRALTAKLSINTEGHVVFASGVIVPITYLALASIAEASTLIVTINILDAVYAGVPEHSSALAERRKISAPVVIDRVTGLTSARYALTTPGLLTVIVASARRALKPAIDLCAEGAWIFALRWVFGITCFADLVDALWSIPTTVRVALTTDAAISVGFLNADRRIFTAPTVVNRVAGLTPTIHTDVGVLVSTISVSQARDTIDATGAKGRLSAAARVVGHITEPTITADALSRPDLITVAITEAADTIGPAVDAEGRLAAAACVVRWVAEDAGVRYALTIGAITVASAPETFTAIGRTERGVSPAARVVRRVTGEARVSDALIRRRVATIKVSATAHAAQRAVLIYTDRGVPVAAVIGALDTEHARTGHTLARAGLVTVRAVETGRAFAAVGARSTERCRAITAGVVRLVAGRAIPIDALTLARIDAVPIIGAAYTGRPRWAVDAVRLVAATAVVTIEVTDHALLVDALVAIAVAIGPAVHAG